MFDRFSEEDGFGVFWSVVHALEATDNREQELGASVRRVPNLFNTLMVNRIVNAGATCVASVPAEVHQVNAYLGTGGYPGTGD